jgi:osmotically-inducible protein OsmY
MKAEPDTSRLNVKVICRGGQLELAGIVESSENREAAARVAAIQPGVLGVNNQVKVMDAPRW